MTQIFTVSYLMIVGALFTILGQNIQSRILGVVTLALGLANAFGV